MLVNDGAIHVVDSSELAFRSAIQGAFKESFNKAQPLILEPIMDVSLTAPVEFQGNIISLLNKRMATINNTDIGSDEFTISAECSLNGMFGFASQLRAATQGKGEFSLEFKTYAPAPPQLQRELIDEYIKKQKAKK